MKSEGNAKKADAALNPGIKHKSAGQGTSDPENNDPKVKPPNGIQDDTVSIRKK